MSKFFEFNLGPNLWYPFDGGGLCAVCEIKYGKKVQGLRRLRLEWPNNRGRFADFTSNRLFMKLFSTGSLDVVQECRSYFGLELPSCLIYKKKYKFLSRYNCWRTCFVDIVVSCDFFCAAVQRIDFFFLLSNFICLQLLNKVDQ